MPKTLNIESQIDLSDSNDIKDLAFYLFDPIIRVFDNNFIKVATIKNYNETTAARFSEKQLRELKYEGSNILFNHVGAMEKANTIKHLVLDIKGKTHYCAALVYYLPFKIRDSKASTATKEGIFGGIFSS